MWTTLVVFPTVMFISTYVVLGQLADDPDAARKMAIDELDDASGSSVHHVRKVASFKKHVKRVHKKTLIKVGHTAALVLRKSIMVEKIEVPKTIEFQELIYIYCAKPSEMKEKQVKGGPLVGGDRAIMANLSEPQLANFINMHPMSLIE